MLLLSSIQATNRSGCKVKGYRFKKKITRFANSCRIVLFDKIRGIENVFWQNKINALPFLQAVIFSKTIKNNLFSEAKK